MTINWQLPVETIEDPPRPVMVLYALGNDTPYGFIVYNVTKTATDEFWLMTDENRPDIRNVAPKPVRLEAWVVWDADGAVLAFSTETSAKMHGGIYARATAMSDGSPVVSDAPDAPWEENSEYWKAKADEWKAKAIKAQADAGEIINQMRPVVDAAVAWASRGFTLREPWEAALFEAVRAYQNAEPATSDSHEAVVGDVLATIREKYLADNPPGPLPDAFLDADAVYALFKDGKQISKTHSTKIAAATEAYEHGAVVRWSGDFTPGSGVVLAKGYEVREAKS